MAGQRISAILARARVIIAGTIPDYEPTTVYREAATHAPLERLAFSGALDGTRRFHVLSSAVAGSQGPRVLQLNGDSVLLSDSIAVRIRYHVPLRQGGIDRLSGLTGDDAQRITQALISLIGDGAEASCVAYLDPVEQRLEPITEAGGESEYPEAWVLTLGYEIKSWIV